MFLVWKVFEMYIFFVAYLLDIVYESIYNNHNKILGSDAMEQINDDPFYTNENIAELVRRVEDVKSGKSTLKEHKLIDVDDELKINSQ